MIFDGMYEGGYHMMDWVPSSWWAFGWLFMLIGWVIYFTIGIIIANYVHRDAIKRRIQNSEVWVLIILIFNVLGFLIYLITRGNYAEQGLMRKEITK